MEKVNKFKNKMQKRTYSEEEENENNENIKRSRYEGALITTNNNTELTIIENQTETVKITFFFFSFFSLIDFYLFYF